MDYKKLDGMKNLEVRVRKDGERRRTAARNDAVSAELEKANSPGEMGKLATKYGIGEDEILARAKASPNFGQFRMVLGNRIRGITARKKENPSATYAEIAGMSKSKRAGKKPSGKKVIKVTAKPKPKVKVAASAPKR